MATKRCGVHCGDENDDKTGCVPCELHGFCHLCEVEAKDAEIDALRAENEALRADALAVAAEWLDDLVVGTIPSRWVTAVAALMRTAARRGQKNRPP